MPDDSLPVPTDTDEPPKAQPPSLQKKEAFYRQIPLPEGWDEIVEPDVFFQHTEETRRYTGMYNARWLTWQNLACHLASLLILLIVIIIHFSGLHHWAIFNLFISPSPRPSIASSEACHLFHLTTVPKDFKEKTAQINHAIKEKNMGSAAILLAQILDSPQILDEPEFYKECLACAVKTLVFIRDYHEAWMRFLELERHASEKETLIPYSAMYAGILAKYHLATRGSYGNGMPVTEAANLITLLEQMRADYSEEMDKDERILLFEADALLSFLGEDDKKFDLENQQNIAIWEQFERTLSQLIRLESESREITTLRYRKWLKIKHFCYIPFYNERIIIGKYAYDEAFAEKRQAFFSNQMKE